METPLPDYETHRRSAGPSWPLLLALAVVIAGTAALMVPNVWYTGGETIMLLDGLGVIITLLSLLVGFHSRLMAAWLILGVGGTLILWQAWQACGWGMVQEEVIAILDYAKRQKAATGTHPPNLDAYTFRHPGTRGRIHYYFHEGKLVVSYPMLDQAHFWHHEDGGFLFNGD